MLTVEPTITVMVVRRLVTSFLIDFLSRDSI